MFKEIPSQIAKSLPKLPTLPREFTSIRNQTAVLALSALAALSAGCGGKSTSEQTVIIEDIGCNPVPPCPLTKHSEWSDSPTPVQHYEFFDQSGRWRRFDPKTGAAVIVCDPYPLPKCEEGQTPDEDGCSAPTCESALEEMCDPIPSFQHDGMYMQQGFTHANIPTSSNNYYPDPSYYNETNQDYPIIFDRVVDAKEGDEIFSANEGESIYRKDIIPTCDKENQIQACRELPRCKENESPISCTVSPNAHTVTQRSNCSDYQMDEAAKFLAAYGFSIDPPNDYNNGLCFEGFDSNANEVFFVVPNYTINCLPVRECNEGEDPETAVEKAFDVTCDGATFKTTFKMANCDPIKSCE